MRDENCDKCHYFVRFDTPIAFSWGDYTGRCHRNPPTASNIEESLDVGVWPYVEPVNWCGEYKAASLWIKGKP